MDKKTILIADDEPDVRAYLGTLMEDNGFDVLLAENGEQAMDMAINKKPDLISLDISMPEKSGARALKELTENEATNMIPIIVVTGVDPRYKQFIHTRRTVTPPTAYFEKPVKPEEFVEKVFELLGMAKPE